MSSPRHESEIVVVVIRSIAVDMVDNLICSQPPSDALFHDYNVLAATFVFPTRELDIAVRLKADSFGWRSALGR